MEKWIIVYIFFVSIVINAQNRIEIKGHLIGDNTEIAQLHIYNLQTKKGTISNQQGHFFMQVAKDDVLLISSIQFSDKKYTVTKLDIFSKTITILLESEATNLDEIVINSHNLSGNLIMDIKKVPKNFQSHLHYKLDLDGINFDAPAKVKSPKDIKLPDPLRTSETVNSVNLMPLIGLLTKGIRKKQQLKKLHKKRLQALPITIRNDFGDAFFEDKLKIPKPLIDDFLQYCQQKDILRLYLQNKKMDLIESFFSQSKLYLKSIKP